MMQKISTFVSAQCYHCDQIEANNFVSKYECDATE